MRHLKLSIAVVAGLMLFSSCKKKFVCVCPYPNNTPAYKAEYPISAKDNEEAVKRCDNYDNADIKSDCALK